LKKRRWYSSILAEEHLIGKPKAVIKALKKAVKGRKPWMMYTRQEEDLFFQGTSSEEIFTR